jgi:hypothetical protein
VGQCLHHPEGVVRFASVAVEFLEVLDVWLDQLVLSPMIWRLHSRCHYFEGAILLAQNCLPRLLRCALLLCLPDRSSAAWYLWPPTIYGAFCALAQAIGELAYKIVHR